MSIIKVDYGTVSGGGINPSEALVSTGASDKLDGRTVQLEVGKSYVLTFTSNSNNATTLTNADILYSRMRSTTWSNVGVICHCVIFKVTGASVTFNTTNAYSFIVARLD